MFLHLSGALLAIACSFPFCVGAVFLQFSKKSCCTWKSLKMSCLRSAGLCFVAPQYNDQNAIQSRATLRTPSNPLHHWKSPPSDCATATQGALLLVEVTGASDPQFKAMSHLVDVCIGASVSPSTAITRIRCSRVIHLLGDVQLAKTQNRCVQTLGNKLHPPADRAQMEEEHRNSILCGRKIFLN